MKHYPRLTVVAFLLGASLSAAEPLDIGSDLELFVDDYLVESIEGAELELHHPEPEFIVLIHDNRASTGGLSPYDWEGNTTYSHCLVNGRRRSQIYYIGTDWIKHVGEVQHRTVAVAESTNGYSWQRPPLDYYEFNDTEGNPLVLPAEPRAQQFTAFYDANPNANRRRKYKAIAAFSSNELVTFTSDDGYDWTEREKFSVEGAGSITAFWLPAVEKYFVIVDAKQIYQSDDFKSFTGPTSVDLGADLPAGVSLQRLSAQPYFRAAQIVVAMPTRYTTDRNTVRAPYRGLTDIGFATSRDGVHYSLHSEALRRPGPDHYNWQTPGIASCAGFVQLNDTTMSVFWRERNFSHYEEYESGKEGCRLRRGTLRLDGLVSVSADTRGGRMTTRPFTFTGSKLLLNYATDILGSIQVELLDADSNPISGYTPTEIYGDEIAATYSWAEGKDLASLAGKPIRLRFTLKDADVYSIQFK